MSNEKNNAGEVLSLIISLAAVVGGIYLMFR